MENMDSYMVQLITISRIPQGGKLDTTGTKLAIYGAGSENTGFGKPFYMLSNLFYRMYNGDGREKTVKRLQSLYKDVRKIVDDIVEAILDEPSNLKVVFMQQQLCSIAIHVNKSLSGITTLKRTYENFPEIVSELEHLETSIIIPLYTSIVKYLPRGMLEERTEQNELTLSALETNDNVQKFVSKLTESPPKPEKETKVDPENSKKKKISNLNT